MVSVATTTLGSDTSAISGVTEAVKALAKDVSEEVDTFGDS